MKILILTDLEGVAGVSVDRQLNDIANPYYRMARGFLADEVNAAVLGAKEAGATEFVVADGHGSGFDMMLDFGRISPEATFITGEGNPLVGVDDTFDAFFMVGQHPRRGPRGVLEHTGSNLGNQGTWLNDVEVGEAGLLTAILAERGIPLALLTGDEEVVAEMTPLVQGFIGVPVKRALARQLCVSLHPAEACRRIREGASRAVKALDKIRSWHLSPPYVLTIAFGSCAVAERYAPLVDGEAGHASGLLPYVTRVNENTIRVSAPTLRELGERHYLLNRIV
ncbi:MAG: M55 family metallopeptidase [Candidatus Omnitrophica bacterium]|nr:M55 family metallopeptidase [Candidatus Omnitrophota bacterium]